MYFFSVNGICIAAEIMINAMNALATVLSAVVAVWALLHAAGSVRKSAKNIHYAELDNIYLELLKKTLSGFSQVFMAEQIQAVESKGGTSTSLP